MSQWQNQPDIAASRRQHRHLYQAQGRYLRYVGLLTLASVLYYPAFQRGEQPCENKHSRQTRQSQPWHFQARE